MISYRDNSCQSKAGLLVSSCFQDEKYDRFNVLFLVWFENRDLKDSSSEESRRIVAHENAHFSNGSYETKTVKMRNTELCLKGARYIYGSQR